MTSPGVALIAPAKVNLALHVIGQRTDGYHLLDSIAVFADVGDRIEIGPGGGLDLKASGRFAAHAPADSTDLAWRAAEAFFEHTKIPKAVSIRVEKNVPAGAGLGGGSADAAAVLRGLDQYFDTRVPAGALAAIGLKLGADVPMCLTGRALRAQGIGEEISVLENWPELPLVLVWPGRAVSTAEVFRSLARRDNPPLSAPPAARSPREMVRWLGGCRNDLEAPAIKIAPEIGTVLQNLRDMQGCLLARMSGSGSACFGLYAEASTARLAATAMGQKWPGWWISVTEAR